MISNIAFDAVRIRLFETDCFLLHSFLYFLIMFICFFSDERRNKKVASKKVEQNSLHIRRLYVPLEELQVLLLLLPFVLNWKIMASCLICVFNFLQNKGNTWWLLWTHESCSGIKCWVASNTFSIICILLFPLSTLKLR